MYIHERKQWPHFSWDSQRLGALLADVRHWQGRLLGRMEALGFSLREEATLKALTQEVVKTSQIEGESLNTEQVRSSIARRLGIKIVAPRPVDRSVEGIVEVLLDATRHFESPLTKKRLCAWHAALFPSGRSGLREISMGAWRGKSSGPMQVVSGPYGHEKVHYEAPSYNRLAKEMKDFLQWFNAENETDLLLKSALAHFWFVTLHPFEDGNGRIARALADLLLAKSEGSPQRFYSLSSQIESEREDYYDILEKCQKGSLDISPWMEWFLNCLKRAILKSEETLEDVLGKSKFWKIHAEELFNERQRAILNRLLDGFQGNLTSSKWAKLAKCSQDTALRDLNDLVERKILKKNNAGGRSTHYRLILS
ncbi:MAG: Fic family protein [Deltaproteobacteria bacterium]|nr:Fic family protein [Deltaproteobacteria bacterium]